MTLDDLKRAIVRIGPHPTEQDDDLRWKHFHYQRSEAWKAAFEWRDGIPAGGSTEEYLEGMALIRKQLK